jgi:hypothetical protein
MSPSSAKTWTPLVVSMLTWWEPPAAPAPRIPAPQSTHQVLRGFSSQNPVSGLAGVAQHPAEGMESHLGAHRTDPHSSPANYSTVCGTSRSRKPLNPPAQTHPVNSGPLPKMSAQSAGEGGLASAEHREHTWEHDGPMARSSRSQEHRPASRAWLLASPPHREYIVGCSLIFDNIFCLYQKYMVTTGALSIRPPTHQKEELSTPWTAVYIYDSHPPSLFPEQRIRCIIYEPFWQGPRL